MQILIGTESNNPGITRDEQTMLRQLFDTKSEESDVQEQFIDLLLLQGLTK
jgi:hypothetical protein